jgi:hypothetical protein
VRNTGRDCSVNDKKQADGTQTGTGIGQVLPTVILEFFGSADSNMRSSLRYGH